jgi:hypothetical protein
MTRFALALLLVTACGAAMPPPVAPVPRASARKVHPMAGDWLGTLTTTYARTGQPTVHGKKPFALSLADAPTSLGGGGGLCDLHAVPEGDHVRFPTGQVCAGKKDGGDFVTTLREGTLSIADKLELSLVFDGAGGDELVVRGSLARRTHA